MFFQYAGLSDWEASFTVSASWLAAMLVAPFVGCLGDAVHRRYPNKGRPVIAQSAILVRSLLMFSILYCVPKKRESFLLFLLLSSLIGLMAGWPGVGVNRPILTEIVLPKHRATVFSLVRHMREDPALSSFARIAEKASAGRDRPAPRTGSSGRLARKSGRMIYRDVRKYHCNSLCI